VGLPVEDSNALKIRIPAPPGQIVGMADPVAINRPFITDFAARHEGNLPYKYRQKVYHTVLMPHVGCAKINVIID
jgi:hypothetical protein